MAGKTNRIRPVDDAPTSRPTTDLAPKRQRKTDGKVRTTVVLDADEYHSLGEFCLGMERATGRRGVASSEVVRVLLGLVATDPEVRSKVTEQIEQHGGNRRGRA